MTILSKQYFTSFSTINSLKNLVQSENLTTVTARKLTALLRALIASTLLHTAKKIL